MSTNLGSPSPGEIPQNIGDVNAILGRFAESRQPNVSNVQGRLYLVIDARTNTIGLTSDKRHASSLKEVAGWINEFAQKTLSSGPATREEINDLRARCHVLVESLPKTRLQKIAGVLFGYKTAKEAIQQVGYAIDDHLSSYGKVQKSRTLVDFSDPKNPIKSTREMDKSLSYADYGERQAKLKSDVRNNFEKTKDLEEIDQEDITGAFNDELAFGLYPKFPADRNMHRLATGAFEDLLDQFSEDKRGLSPAELLTNFKSQLRAAIEKRNHVRESVGRDTFRDLMGNKVKDGKGKPADDIDLNSVKQLIQEYNDGTWPPEEERMLEYDAIPPDKLRKKMQLLASIIDSEAFHGVMLKYFGSLPLSEEPPADLDQLAESRKTETPAPSRPPPESRAEASAPRSPPESRKAEAHAPVKLKTRKGHLPSSPPTGAVAEASAPKLSTKGREVLKRVFDFFKAKTVAEASALSRPHLKTRQRPLPPVVGPHVKLRLRPRPPPLVPLPEAEAETPASSKLSPKGREVLKRVFDFFKAKA